MLCIEAAAIRNRGTIMRHGMSSGSGGGAGGGSSILNKKSGMSSAEKRKLMEMSGSDRFALMVAQKTMEVKSRLMDKKIEELTNKVDANGESKLNGKAKKALETMFKSQFQKEYKQTRAKIEQNAKERAEERKQLLRGSNNAATAAQQAAQYQQQKQATQDFIKKFYNTDDLKGSDSGNNWW
jgi:hypothetical protein